MGAVRPINVTTARRSPQFAHRLQAWGAALCFGVFGSLPLNCASTLGGALARHIGPRLGISNRARRNLRCALPELSDDEIARVVAGMWDNLGRVVAEYPHLRKIDVFEPGGRVEIRGLEYINRAVATGRRIIFSGHLANWEIGALAAVQCGLSVAQIYRAANNPLVDRMIARFRGDRAEFIPKGTVAARHAIAALRRGAHLTLLADQKMNDGIPVPFFGRPAMTAPALADLALRFSTSPGRTARRRPLPAYRISATAITTKRRAACRRCSADGQGQCDIGGVDSRPTGAMALGAPTLAGLAATIAKRHSGAREQPWTELPYS
jgi:KDO2-lipid IV(A) lauroyltransferase